MGAHGWARCLARLRELESTLRLGNLADLLPFRRAQDLARRAEGLRRAGPLRRLRRQVWSWEISKHAIR
jgi:hypothetical protein